MEVRVLSWAPKTQKPLQSQRLFHGRSGGFGIAPGARRTRVPTARLSAGITCPLFAQQRLQGILQSTRHGRIAGTGQHAGRILPPGLRWAGSLRRVSNCNCSMRRSDRCSAGVGTSAAISRRSGLRSIASRYRRRGQCLRPGRAMWQVRRVLPAPARKAPETDRVSPGCQQLCQRFAMGLSGQLL